VPTTRTNDSRWDFRDALAVLGILAAAALAFAQSRGRWLDPIVDAGRDLYVPEQLAAGAKLYRDYRYNYPPAAPYLLAAIVRLFGSSLQLYVAIGAALAAVCADALYSTMRMISGRAAAFTAALLFVALSLACRTSFNFFFPYAEAMTIGIAAVMLFLLFLVRYVWVGRSGLALAGAALFGTLAAWSKLEFALVVLACAFVIWLLHDRSVRFVLAFAVPNAVVFLFCALVFREPGDPFGWIRGNMLSSSLVGGASAFYGHLAGWDPNRERFVAIAFGSLLLGATAVLLHLMARRWGQVESRKGPDDAGESQTRSRAASFAFRPDPGTLLAFAALIAGVFVAPSLFFRPWPLIHLALLPLLFRPAWRTTPLPLLWTASVTATLRIALDLSPSTSGFAYLLPTYLLAVFVAVEVLPGLKVHGRELSKVWLGLMIGVAIGGLLEQRARYRTPAVAVVTARGTFLDADAGRARVMQWFLRDLRTRPAAETLAVFPEGVSLDYFARRRTPLRYYLFTPPETADLRIEADVIRDLAMHPPDLVALVTRDVSEYGSHGFGVDYDRELAETIAALYVRDRVWAEGGFRLELLRRRVGGGGSRDFGSVRNEQDGTAREGAPHNLAPGSARGTTGDIGFGGREGGRHNGRGSVVAAAFAAASDVGRPHFPRPSRGLDCTARLRAPRARGQSISGDPGLQP
jgi:hypothetical protein